MANVYVRFLLSNLESTICLFIEVTAIANYTTRVVDNSLSAEQLQEALKFLGAFVTFMIRVCFNNFQWLTRTGLLDHVSSIPSTNQSAILLPRFYPLVHWRYHSTTPCRSPRSWWEWHRRQMQRIQYQLAFSEQIPQSPPPGISLMAWIPLRYGVWHLLNNLYTFLPLNFSIPRLWYDQQIAGGKLWQLC